MLYISLPVKIEQEEVKEALKGNYLLYDFNVEIWPIRRNQGTLL